MALKCQNAATAMIEQCQTSFYMWAGKGRVKTACGRGRNIALFFFEIGLVLFSFSFVAKFYTEDKVPVRDFVFSAVYGKRRTPWRVSNIVFHILIQKCHFSGFAHKVHSRCEKSF